MNRRIDPKRFTFEQPKGVELHDDRPEVFTDREPMPDLHLPSIAEAQAGVDFPLRTSVSVPPGYTFSGTMVRQRVPVRSFEDDFEYSLFLYNGPAGEWLVVSQGASVYAGMTSIAPDNIPHGTTTVRSLDAAWVNGRPVAGEVWEPGTMTIVEWEDPAGNGDVGQQFALASNALGVEELRAVAESLR